MGDLARAPISKSRIWESVTEFAGVVRVVETLVRKIWREGKSMVMEQGAAGQVSEL